MLHALNSLPYFNSADWFDLADSCEDCCSRAAPIFATSNGPSVIRNMRLAGWARYLEDAGLA
jgi:hypothetical protein